MSGNTTTIEQELSLLKGSQVMSALSPKNCAIERSEQLSYFAILSHYVTQLLDYLSACLKKYLPWINDILQSALTIFFASPRCTNIFFKLSTFTIIYIWLINNITPLVCYRSLAQFGGN